ncbi:ATP-NAD kinase [Saccharopolyspora erythraea D]|nr:ATP-NAD kinase [Saccharopolyspora erythraea D]
MEATVHQDPSGDGLVPPPRPAGELPVVPGSALGIIANPMSGRDIRRLVAHASVFPNAEKTNMVLRLVAAAGALGVERVLVSTDDFGVAGGVLRAARKRTGQDPGRWPRLDFCELDTLTGTAEDTRRHVRRMRAQGAEVIIVLGGDGTVRAAASELGDTALLPLSTGTNNAFPEMWEATVAGSAAALVATGRADATRQAKVLHVECGDRREPALVDVCVSTTAHVGARALWQVDELRELYCTFAEPHAIGLSSIAGQLLPTARHDPVGVAIELAGGRPSSQTVLAPIAPGRIVAVEVADARPLPLGQRRVSATPAGTVAVDGERELEFGPGTPVAVTLSDQGPRVVDVRSVLEAAARQRLLTPPPPLSPRPS